MKKTLTLAAIFIAMASYGGSMLLAHAQSLTPAQMAADQQELDVLKAKLVYLQTQEGMIPAGDAGGVPTVAPAPTPMMLSASDVVAIKSALTSLTGALVTLQSDIANNPQILTTNGQGVTNVLKGINATLASIGSEMRNGNIAMTPSTGSGQAAPVVAQSNPSAVATAPTTNQTMPAATAPTTAVTTPAPTVAITPSVNTAPQTAQAGSSFSASNLNWPLIIVIILIVAAIAIWLWWDDSDDTKAKPVVKNISSAPQRQAPIVQITNNVQAPASPAQPTPMSNVVANPQTRKPA